MPVATLSLHTIFGRETQYGRMCSSFVLTSATWQEARKCRPRKWDYSIRQCGCTDALGHGIMNHSCVGGVDNNNRDRVWGILTSVPIFSELDPVLSSTVTLLYWLASSCTAPLVCPSPSLPHAWPNLREEENEMSLVSLLRAGDIYASKFIWNQCSLAYSSPLCFVFF